MSKVKLVELLDRVYPDRRDRYGFTFLSRSRAIRAVKKCNDEAVRRLIDTDVLETLVKAKVILAMRIVRGKQDEYVFFVQKRIRPVLVPSEWSPTMFVDAAQLVLLAEKELCAHDMTVDDPHPWNVLFDEGKPYIVDMGAFNIVGTRLHWSVKQETQIWPAASAFNAFFLNAVALAAAGRGHHVRRILTDWNPISGSDTALMLLKNPATLFSFLAVRSYTKILGSVWLLMTSAAFSNQRRKLKSVYLAVLNRYVDRMRAKIIERMAIVGQGTNISVGTAYAIRLLIEHYSRPDLIVYGANLGTVDYIRDVAGPVRLLIVSPDDAFVDCVYRTESERLAVAVMDLRSPTPGTGPSNRWISPGIERFKSEVGIFFFNLEELILEKCLTVAELIQAARNMSDAGALIVFGKLPRENNISGRNYGQTEDQVLLACLAQNLEMFEIVHNNNSEMAVAFGRNKLNGPSNEN